MTNDRTKPIPDFYVYLMFTASGASALIYQVLWARWLGLVFGNTTTSISVILASFMLGLALGSFVVGRRLATIKNPMTLYAYLELAIGIFALCFPLFSSLTESGYAALVTSDSPVVWSLSVRTLFAFILLLAPTTFMGATLPLLTDFFRRSPAYSDNWKVGLLYASNTVGAALGTALASFLLIELVGIRSTTILAAGLNLMVAWVALRLSHGPVSEVADVLQSVQKALPFEGKCALVVLALSGGMAMASEVLWTRALEVLIGNSTYAFATILVVYLLGIALGSWLMSLRVNRFRLLGFWLAGTQIGMALWSLIAIFCFTLLGDYLTQYSRQAVSITRSLAIYGVAASLLLPLALLSGAAFPVATRMIQPKGDDAAGELIARAYSWNTIGAVVGSLLAGFVIAATLDYFQSIYLLICGYALTGLVFIQAVRERGRRSYIGLAVCSLGLCVWSTPQIFKSDRFIERLEHRTQGKYTVAYHEPGLQGVTSVVRDVDDELGSILLVNGSGMTVKVTDTKMMSHIPMLLHPEPRDTLVVCFGMGTTYRSAISHGYNVTVVELVGEVVTAFPYFHEDAGDVLGNRRGRVLINDGRNYLRTTQNLFDVITIDPPPPIDGRGVTSLHSIEFIELAKHHLKPGGLMVHWIPFPWSVAGVDDWETFDMLTDTFRSAFPYAVTVTSINNMGLHVIGSMTSIDTSLTAIKDRLTRGGVAADLNEWQQVPDDYFRKIQPLPARHPDEILLLSDDRPYLEFNLLRNLARGTVEEFPTVYW